MLKYPELPAQSARDAGITAKKQMKTIFVQDATASWQK
jgi:hypothetical protein